MKWKWQRIEAGKSLILFVEVRAGLRHTQITSIGVRLRRMARSVASHAADNVPLAFFTLPGVREPFFRGFAIYRRLRTIQRDNGVLLVLADREGRQLVARDFPHINVRFVHWACCIVRPTREAIAVVF